MRDDERPEAEHGVDPAGTIGFFRVGMDPGDDVGHPGRVSELLRLAEPR